MDDKELKQILATKAPAYQRSLIEIPKDCFAPHHSSLTDYLDSVLGDSREMQNRIDNLVMRYRLGAVDKTKNEHFGTILPRINKKGMIVGGSVIYYNTDGGTIIEKDSLVAHLYSHQYRGGQVVIVQEEKTALLGSLAFPDIDWLAVGVGNNLTGGMMKKLIGRQVVLYPDDFSCDFWREHYGKRFKVDESFIRSDINQYLIDFIHNQQVP